jgi:hypothetical protein
MKAIHSGHVEEWLDRWLPAPLYESERGEDVITQGMHLRAFGDRYETYCPECGKDSIFQASGDPTAQYWLREDDLSGREDSVEPELRWPGPFTVELRCSRHEWHAIRLYFELDIELPAPAGPSEIPTRVCRLTKVGQWPSLLDFRLHEIAEVEAAFSNSLAREWRRSLVTAAHGFNVAACVHLRRVFEGLLLEVRDQVDSGVHKGADWPEFDRGRTGDRIRLVASELPPLIVQHPDIYGLLSKGVHELTEEECAREMPILQRAMRVAAQQRLDARTRADEAVQIRSLLADASARLRKT